MMNISVVIPNFNGEKLLRNNLPKVVSVFKKYTSGDVEIIITDDASKDNSVSYVQEYIKNVNTKSFNLHLLQNTSGKNKGFSGNVDKGVNHATGEIIILLNTDVVPHDDFLAPLLKHFSNEKVFAVGCMDESVEEGRIVLRGRGVGEWHRGFLIHTAGNVEKSEKTLWASCGSGAFRKSTWDSIGGLNELYNPFYWEDIDLSYKAQKAGYMVLFEKESIVRHEHEIGSIKKNYTSFTVKTTAYRNQFFFTWLNATDTMIVGQHILFLPYFLLKACLRKDTAFLLGFYRALLMLPSVLNSRKKVQKMVRQSDKKVVHEFISEI